MPDPHAPPPLGGLALAPGAAAATIAATLLRRAHSPQPFLAPTCTAEPLLHMLLAIDRCCAVGWCRIPGAAAVHVPPLAADTLYTCVERWTIDQSRRRCRTDVAPPGPGPRSGRPPAHVVIDPASRRRGTSVSRHVLLVVSALRLNSVSDRSLVSDLTLVDVIGRGRSGVGALLVRLVQSSSSDRRTRSIGAPHSSHRS